MIAVIMIGVAGILFMLGVISLQIASFKPNSLIASIVLMLIFLACLGLSILIAFAALTAGTTPL